MSYLIAATVALVLSIGGFFGLQQFQSEPTFGAVTPFTSKQLAPTPSNGDCLTTDGSLNIWDTCGAGPGPGGDNAYEIATTTNIAVPQLSYFTKTGGLTTLGSVATGTISAGAGISLDSSVRSAVGGALAITATLGTDIAAAEFADGDWGELTAASGVVTIDDGIIESEHLGDDDWGDITVTSNVAAVEDDSHNHTSGTISGLGTLDISGLDISNDTNLTAGDHITLTDDDLDVDDDFILNTGDVGTGSYTFPYASSTAFNSTFASSTFASSTQLTNSSNTWLTTMTSALLLTGTDGLIAEYAGAGCTNQVVEDISALGASTCVSINNGYWSGTDLSVANGGTGLSTFGGTNHVLYTSAADSLTSEAAFAYTASTDNLAFVFGSTTSLTSSAGSWFAGTSGNVGIGTSSPYGKLAIQGIAGNTQPIFNVASSSQISYLQVLSTGTTTISGNTAASSTMYIYSTAASKGGSFIVEDADGAGCTEVSFLNATQVLATVTCPTEI